MAGSKRATSTTSPAPRKRARAPAAAPQSRRARPRALRQKLEKEAPALWANLAEFREELVPQAPHAYGTERAYLKHLELLVYLRALRHAGGDAPDLLSSGHRQNRYQGRNGLGEVAPATA